MSLKSIVREVRGGLGSLSRGRFDWRKDRSTTVSRAYFDLEENDGVFGDQSFWSALPPELLCDVVKRLEEENNGSWPARKHVVACAGVCRSWRKMCKEMAGTPETKAKLTFPLHLKQPGCRTELIQCYIKRNKSSSTYHLYVGLNTDNGKFLLAAKKFRHATHADYIISSSSQDLSQNSINYMGKLRSNFLGTKFGIYDNQPPRTGAVTSTRWSSQRFYSRKVSPKVPSGNYRIGKIDYELNMLGARGPRRLRCTMHSIPISSLEPNGTVPSYSTVSNSLEDIFSSIPFSHSVDGRAPSDFKSICSSQFADISLDLGGKTDPLVLKNKAPRWHEQLQCWCLNFRGRVTIASVKNFQLIAACTELEDNINAGATQTSTAAGASQAAGSNDHDKVILQFGKIGRDLFTMDYRYPLSAFQAFAICLSSFDTKLACE